MKSNKIFLFTILAAFFASCDAQLEIDPKQNEDQSITLSTEEGIANILIGTYSIAATGDAYGGSILLSGDLLGQTGVTSTTKLRYRGTNSTYKQMYFKELLVDNAQVNAIYTNCYEIINAANTVIDNIDKVQDPEKQKTMVAEATFLRSLAYFDLVRFFAKQYIPGQVNSQLGVVIRPDAIYDFSTDLSKERSTVEEVYNVVISGLKLAYNDLPADNGFYANKYAAQALLARVYLQQGNFAAARTAADDVITNSGATLSSKFKDAFNHDVNQSEDIFAIQITKQTGDNQANNLYASEDNGGRGGDIEIRNNYLNQFNDINDERRNFNYVNSDNGRRLTSKFKSEFGDVTIIRLAEMYLIRAETNFRLSTTVGDTPLNDINTLRNRAVATNYTTLTLANILTERQLELGMEGFLIHDQKRTQTDIDPDIPYDSDLLIFPIPLGEMDTNKKITQNPGY